MKNNFDQLSDWKKDPKTLTIALLVVTTLIRIYIAANTGLGVGESYYWRGAQLLDWSYFDQPPLFFWLSGLTTRIFGLTNLALRLPAVLLFAGTIWLIFLITKRLFNAWAGFYAALLFNFSFVFTIPIAAWFQPDAPLVFFWMLSVYSLVHIFFPDDQAIKEEKISVYKWWVLAGVSMGLTVISKYHALFLIFSILIFVLTNPEQRRWILHPGPYIALVTMILFLIPVVYWNAQNNWISFNFQGSRAGDGSLSLSRFFKSIAGQMVWIAPWLWFPLILQLLKAGKRITTDSRYSLLFWCAVIPIGFFTFIALITKIGFHFHWQAPGYMMLFIPLGVTVATKIQQGSKLVKRWLIWSGGLTFGLSFILLVHMTTGFWNILGPKSVGQLAGAGMDPTIEGTDYEDIRIRFEQEGWMDNDSIFVATERWWQTGKIDWPLKGEKDILIFGTGPRNYAFFFNPAKMLGKDAICIRYKKSNEPPSNYLIPFFDEVTALDDIEVKRSGKTELSLQVFYCTNFHTPDSLPYEIPLHRSLLGKPPY